MEEHVDQRRTERFSCESPIVCSTLNGKTVYPARTLNHCDSGISFITRTPLKAGTTIFFRADTRTQNRVETQTCPTMRGTGLAQVRWCRKLRGRDDCFCVGAEYVEPYP